MLNTSSYSIVEERKLTDYIIRKSRPGEDYSTKAWTMKSSVFVSFLAEFNSITNTTTTGESGSRTQIYIIIGRYRQKTKEDRSSTDSKTITGSK